MKKFTSIKESNIVLPENPLYNELTEPILDEPIVNEPIVNEEDSQVTKFFSKLFESKEMAHIYHLQVNNQDNSLSLHLALDEYYKDLPELIDKLIETYQGQYGIVDGYEMIDYKEIKSKTPVEYFENLGEFIKYNKQCISNEDTHLHSIIDDISILLYQTLYKMKFMK